jgi:uncharacterized protein (TIGR00266 family)
MSEAYGWQTRAGQRIDLPSPTVVTRGQGQTGMEYAIIGTTLQAAILELDPGETVFSESGAMAWMSANILMETTGRGGGLGGMLKRAISGESLFFVEYTSQGGKGTVAFAADFPGKIVPIHLAAGQQIIAQKDAFLCAEKTVQTDVFFNRKLGTGFFGGEGFILQRFTGPGVVFVSLDGEVVEYTLDAGQTLRVDTGNVAMFEPTVGYDIEVMRGFKNILFGGEGLFLSTVRGPGRVWLQTMPMMNLARAIGKYLPSGASGSGGGNSGGFNLGSLFNE